MMSAISLVTIKSEINSNIKESNQKNSMLNPFRDKKFSLEHIKIRQTLLDDLNQLGFDGKEQHATENQRQEILKVFDKAINASEQLCKSNGNKGKDQHGFLVEQRNRIYSSEKILVKSMDKNLPLEDRTESNTSGDQGNRFIGKNQL